MAALYTCSFEISGQKYWKKGLEFCWSTKEQADMLGVRGNCSPELNNFVKGKLEAPLGTLNEMKEWLNINGTPENVKFSTIEGIARYSTSQFRVCEVLNSAVMSECFWLPYFPPDPR